MNAPATTSVVGVPPVAAGFHAMWWKRPVAFRSIPSPAYAPEMSACTSCGGEFGGTSVQPSSVTCGAAASAASGHSVRSSAGGGRGARPEASQQPPGARAARMIDA